VLEESRVLLVLTPRLELYDQMRLIDVGPVWAGVLGLLHESVYLGMFVCCDWGKQISITLVDTTSGL
jgi:hypothetical protein